MIGKYSDRSDVMGGGAGTFVNLDAKKVGHGQQKFIPTPLLANFWIRVPAHPFYFFFFFFFCLTTVFNKVQRIVR